MVIGGGVIGLATAHFLQASGAEVTVVERGTCGRATSSGNAGWISPILSAPLPGPHAVAEALRSLAHPNGPVKLAGRPSVALVRWLGRFARASTRARHGRGLLAMLRLGEISLGALDAMRADGVKFEQHSSGMMFAFRSPALLEAYAGQLCPLPSIGYRGEVRVLSADEARAREPLLADSVIGAIHTTADRHVRPESLCAGLVGHLEEAGATISQHAQVASLKRCAGGGWGATITTGERHEADVVVVAAGAASVGMLWPLGCRMLVQCARGHSLTASCASAPTGALYLADRRVGASPYRDGVRFAGLFDVGATDTRVRTGRVAVLRLAAREFLPDWRASGEAVPWAGLRTVAADGLPVIGEVPGNPGVFVATAHGMMGVTLAAATGQMLARRILGGDGTSELDAFRPDRPAVAV